MAVFDTHRAVKTLTAAGFNETQAEALIGAVGESHEALATKADLQDLAQMTKADLQDLAQMTKADLQDLAQMTKAEIQALDIRIQALDMYLQALAQTTKADLKDLELRLTLRLGALVVGAAGVLAVLQVLLP